MSWTRLADLARPHGVVTPALAVAAGIPASTFHDRMRGDAWPAPFPPVRFLPGTRPDHVALTAAAQAYVGPPAAASHDTAAYLLGLDDRPPASVHLLLPHDRGHVERRPGLVVHRSRTLAPTDLTRRQALVTTNAARTVIDLSPRTSPDRLAHLVLAARRDVDRKVVERATGLLRGLPTLPRRRATAALLAELTDDGSESGFEHHATRRLAAAGLAPEAQQHPVTTAGRQRRLDLAWPSVRVAVECLSVRFHSHKAAVERDVERWNELVRDLDGWLLLQLTWRQLVTRAWTPWAQRLAADLRSRGWGA